MYIERDGKRIELTDDEIFEAHKEFIIRWMKEMLESEYDIPENDSRKCAEWTYNYHCESGKSQAECIDIAAGKYFVKAGRK